MMNYPNDYVYKYVEEEISKQNLYDKMPQIIHYNIHSLITLINK